MAASVQCKPQDRSLGMVMKEVDEDLAIFLEMRRREKERNDLVLIQKSNGFDDSAASNPHGSLVSDTMSTVMEHNTPAADNLLNAENPKSDHDWILSPPGSPSFPSLEMGIQETATGQIEISMPPATELKSEAKTPPEEPPALNDTVQTATSTSINSSGPGNRRPSARGGRKSTASRSTTPTRRSALPTASEPSRSSTPSARGTMPPSKPVAPPARSSTPSRINARSSTPPTRSLISSSTSKSTSRSATPTSKASAPSSAPSISVPSGRFSSVNKTRPTMLKNPITLRGTSPTVRSGPKITSELPVSSSEALPNLRVSMPKRPSSASRGRPTASGARSSSTGTTTGRPQQKSCSPLEAAGAYRNASTVLSRSRGYSNGIDDVNPVFMGTKLVERVVNMRKLAPPKQDDQPSIETKKSSLSQENSIGRSLSKKSLDMAIRHMDIRRSISGNLDTIVKSVPASSVYSLRSGSTKTRTTLSASDSPLATSSSVSSELSVNNSYHVFDGNDMEVNYIGIERESFSPTSHQNEKPVGLVDI